MSLLFLLLILVIKFGLVLCGGCGKSSWGFGVATDGPNYGGTDSAVYAKLRFGSGHWTNSWRKLDNSGCDDLEGGNTYDYFDDFITDLSKGSPDRVVFYHCGRDRWHLDAVYIKGTKFRSVYDPNTYIGLGCAHDCENPSWRGCSNYIYDYYELDGDNARCKAVNFLLNPNKGLLVHVDWDKDVGNPGCSVSAQSHKINLDQVISPDKLFNNKEMIFKMLVVVLTLLLLIQTGYICYKLKKEKALYKPVSFKDSDSEAQDLINA